MKAEIAANPITFALIALAGILCVAFAFSLRLDSLEARPLHADEATGARILAERLETGSYSFDPVHFHGPLLTALVTPIAELRGETDWQSLTPQTLRLGIAWFGSITVILTLAFYRWVGFGAVAAAAFVATSPFLVYYSRMFIHETLFGCLAIGTLLALFVYLERPAFWKAGILGGGFGLLMATRETFVICAFAWVVAAGLIAIERYRQGFREIDCNSLRRWMIDALGAGITAFCVTAAFYTDWGSHPSGMIDFFRTFFLYETGEGHDKSFWYYGWLLLWPKFQGGVWWTEAGIALAALIGFALSFGHKRGSWVRFLFYAALIQWLVYSLIAYKTPWLAVTAWLHFCLVAGAGFGFLFEKRVIYWKVAAIVLVLPFLWWHYGQTDRAIHRYASDERNPYAYVPTSADVRRIEPFLLELGGFFPEIAAGPVAIIGRGYWPLPWYLKNLPATGYWQVLPEDGEEFPVLLVMPGQMVATRERLGESHSILPRGLRADTRIHLFIQNEIWDAYLNLDDDD